jgi:hypothetical protein
MVHPTQQMHALEISLKGLFFSKTKIIVPLPHELHAL